MKILQICHRVPFPPIDGGNIAMMNMALSLVDSGHEVYQFCLNTSRHHVDPASIPDELKNKLHIVASDIDTKVKPLAAFLNLFSGESYNMIRFFSMHVANDLTLLLKKHKFDIVQLETLFTTPYINTIKTHSKAKIILRSHNVEHIIWERLALAETNFLKKEYLKLLSRRLKKYELKILKQVDAIISITAVDENIFRQIGYTGKMTSVPLGIDIDQCSKSPSVKSKMVLYHLGSMDWLPNREGVEWFLKECWEKVLAFTPSANLFLAGRDFPNEIKEANHPNVTCDGMVLNAIDYTSDKQIMIVPLLSGSGMRVKIIQGLVASKTIISTSIGAEGIDIENGKNILIADSPDQFAEMIRRCFENEDWCRNIGKNGMQLAKEKYSLEATGKDVTAFLNQLR